MKKLTSVLLGAVVLAAIAPVLTLALLRAVGGTAQAQAPPATFWKVSMPDLGQHSDAWCWVGAAADSFWWLADHAGQTGLLGGADEPWKLNEAASTNAGSVCWYDARDAVDGLPAPVKGYPMVLRKIAESTFTDTNQNGIKDGVETNYCYGQGVEKWDYLIGLRDYVNSNGNNLAVHDIIDPAKCGIHKGLIVNRNSPTQNNLNPCGPGAVAPGGVPGVSQVAGPPQFLDYQTELSGGQDVLLWMEPAPGYYFAETAHVVTGVGYDATPLAGAFGLGTVTISDPWTHTTTPPNAPPGVAGASHTDALPGPWQSKPDHNNSPNHGDHTLGATEPYNRCDVKQLVPSFQIQCYDEDTGAVQPWQVVDMIYVSPNPPTDTPTPTSTPTNTPTATSTPTRTPRPGAVGGIAEPPDATESVGGSSSLPFGALAGIAAAGAVVLMAGVWYARRRWLT